MEKKTLLALALSLLVLIGFQLTISKMYPPRQISTTVGMQTPTDNTRVTVKEPTTEEPSSIAKETILPEITDEREVLFQNKLYSVTFSDIGGSIKKITLNARPSLGLNIPYDILNVTKPHDYLFSFLPAAVGDQFNNAKYNVSAGLDEVTCIKTFSNGLTIEKTYRFSPASYRIDLDVTLKNTKSKDISRAYSIICGDRISQSASEARFLEVTANMDGKLAKQRKQSKPFEANKSGTMNWVMLKSRYFSIITKPATPATGYFVKQDQDGSLAVGINSKEEIIPSGASVTHKYAIYAGLSDLGLLKDSEIGADEALSYGFFGSISQILVSSLRFFHKIFRNWGIAIIILSLFINLILFPLTRKSYKSMQEMQILQPKIHKIQEEYKSNPQKMQKEIMELYKKYKVNPMGGCLPMLLQMPIFIALYNGLLNSVELRGAKFLWIKDLSVPENIHIPYTLPLIGNSFNVLPILMMIGMFFQQRLSNKLSSAAQTPEQMQQQKIMSVMMTVMFAFIFWNFPSGLVIYWLVNTVIMVIYQMLYTRAPKDIEAYA